MPYRYNGLIRVPHGRASGFVVHERVVLTAAHVIHSNGTWTTASFYPQHHRNYSTFNSQFFNAAGSHRWDSYSTRVQRDGPIGGSSRDTFNADIAALFFLPRLLDDGIYAPVHVDGEGEVSIMRDPFLKTVTGYPIGMGTNVGFLHSVSPENYLVFWDALTREPDTWYDSGVGIQPSMWKALYFTDEFLTYSGNSGGPLWVQDELGEWLAAAIVVGFNSASGNSYFRGIDDNAYQLIRAAAASTSGNYSNQRPVSLQAYAGRDGFVYLNWQVEGVEPAEYRILRTEKGVWQTLTRLSGHQRQWVDRSAASGREYRYKVQSIASNGSRSPYGQTAAAQTRGTDYTVGKVLGKPWFAWRNLGDGPFYFDGQSLISGRTRSMGSSILELELEGPGQFEFYWSVDSEENDAYDDPDSHLYGDIYDAFYFYLNGERKAWISGEDEGHLSFDLEASRNLLRWEYRKDPYADEGEDAGRLWSVDWNPAQGSQDFPAAAIIQGSFSLPGDWRQSPAIGPVWTRFAGQGWIFHPAWGWCSMSPLEETGEIFAYRAQTANWLFWSPEHPRSFYCYSQARWLRF